MHEQKKFCKKGITDNGRDLGIGDYCSGSKGKVISGGSRAGKLAQVHKQCNRRCNQQNEICDGQQGSGVDV